MTVRDAPQFYGPIAYWYLEGESYPLDQESLACYNDHHVEVFHDADIDEDGLDFGINWALISPRKEI